MQSSSAYFFLELAVLIYLLGFGWEHWKLKDFGFHDFWFPAISLACFWFLIDQVAVRLGLWAFPQTGALSFRLLSLPIEEYVLFFLHTVVCFILLKQYSRADE
jgi:lycopene cyclase domain-containing protein